MLSGRLRVIALWLTDLACVYSVWVVVVWGYWALGFGYYKYGFDFYLNLWPVGVAFVCVNAVFKLYHGNPLYPAAPLSKVEELRRLFGSSLLTHLSVLSMLALSRQTTEDYSRVVIVFSGLIVAILAQPFRNFVRRLLFNLGVGQIPVFLIGSTQASRKLAASLVDDAYTGFSIVRTFADGARDVVPEARRAGVMILLASEDERLFRCRLEDYASWFTFIEYLPTADTFPIAGAQPVSFDGIGGLEMVNQCRMHAMRLGKTLMDASLSMLAFVCCVPLFLIIPLLIKLTSSGPVFYRAARLGKGGRQIRVWKFRSMYQDADVRLQKILTADPLKKAEWEANFKLSVDPRVTPLGHILRRTSLDEIPQLFNVILGDMSLIGPRPIVSDEVSYYGKGYAIMASVKPGITGLWQVSGRSDTGYDRRVALDTYYVLNWSPWLDLLILFRTFGAVLFMKGAR